MGKYFYEILFFFIGFNFFSLQILDAVKREELPFVIVICTRNSAPWVIKNLDSVRTQEYSNYRIIYIDDASEDNTADRVQAYINKYNWHDKITLIRNSYRCRKTKNEYLAFHMCNDNEIIVQLDGDDWYSNTKVLSNLNRHYHSKDIWLTYGTHKNYPPSSIGAKSAITAKHIIASRNFRKSFIYMPTRSFYAWLVKMIKLEDFLCSDVPGFEGKFYPTCDDCMLMWAMLEMAHHRFKYISKISYIANRGNPNISLKVDKELIKLCSKSLSKKIPLYSVVNKPILNRLEKYDSAKADICILSYSVYDAENMLRNLKNLVKNVSKILVMYQTNDSNMDVSYKALTSKYPEVIVMNIETWAKNKLREYFEKLTMDHVLLLKDTTQLLNNIDCRVCIKQLERTYAYGFYIALQRNDFIKHQVPYENIVDTLYAWKFSCDSKKNIEIQDFNGILYRKSDVSKLLHNYASLHDLEHAWKKNIVDKKRIGLFYEDCIN